MTQNAKTRRPTKASVRRLLIEGYSESDLESLLVSDNPKFDKIFKFYGSTAAPITKVNALLSYIDTGEIIAELQARDARIYEEAVAKCPLIYVSESAANADQSESFAPIELPLGVSIPLASRLRHRSMALLGVAAVAVALVSWGIAWRWFKQLSSAREVVWCNVERAALSATQGFSQSGEVQENRKKWSDRCSPEKLAKNLADVNEQKLEPHDDNFIAEMTTSGFLDVTPLLHDQDLIKRLGASCKNEANADWRSCAILYHLSLATENSDHALRKILDKNFELNDLPSFLCERGKKSNHEELCIIHLKSCKDTDCTEPTASMKKLCEAGLALACKSLGDKYGLDKGNVHPTRNRAEAIKYYDMACEIGIPVARECQGDKEAFWSRCDLSSWLACHKLANELSDRVFEKVSKKDRLRTLQALVRAKALRPTVNLHERGPEQWKTLTDWIDESDNPDPVK